MNYSVGDKIVLDKPDSRFHKVTGVIARIGSKYLDKQTYYITWSNGVPDVGAWTAMYIRLVDEPVIEEDWS